MVPREDHPRIIAAEGSGSMNTGFVLLYFVFPAALATFAVLTYVLGSDKDSAPDGEDERKHGED
jgi:hypothetical protein